MGGSPRILAAGILKKYEARQDIHVDLKTGVLLAESMAERAHGMDGQV